MKAVTPALIVLATFATLTSATPADAQFIPQFEHEAREELAELHDGACKRLNLEAIDSMQKGNHYSDPLENLISLGLSGGGGVGTEFKGAEYSVNTSGLIAPTDGGLLVGWYGRLGMLEHTDGETQVVGSGFASLLWGGHDVGIQQRSVTLDQRETWQGKVIASCDVYTSYREVGGAGLGVQYDTIIGQPGFGLGTVRGYGDYQIDDETGFESMAIVVYPPFPEWGAGLHFNFNYLPWTHDGVGFQYGYYVSLATRAGGEGEGEYVGYFLVGLNLGAGLVNLW